MVGYSRLMAAHESETWAALKKHRKELLDPKTAEYRGRTVKLMGDGTLMEFGSVVDAVLFAVDVQRNMAARNADVPEEKRIVFRIGINIGDIIVAGDDIYGDGVNVASRLEALAEPGGICVSRNVYNQVKNKVEFGFNDLGAQSIKNIPEPVETYGVWWGPKMTTAQEAPAKPRSRTSIIGAVGAVTLLVVAAGIWVLFPFQTARSIEPVSSETMALPLPEKPSIAVLGFETPGLNPDQQFLATALPDAISTEFSRNGWVFVIDPDSSLRYRSTDDDIRRAAEQLGVKYVLGGEISGENRLTIEVHLMDVLAGTQAWRQKFEGGLDDIYGIRNDIVDIVQGKLQSDSGSETIEQAAPGAWASEPRGSAFTHLLRGIYQFRKYTADGNQEAALHFEKAVENDPNFALIHAWRSWNAIVGVQIGWAEPSGDRVRQAIASASKSVSLDRSQVMGYLALGSAFLATGRASGASEQFRLGLDIIPDDARLLAQITKSLAAENKATEAIEFGKQALRLNPRPPDWVYWNMGIAYFVAENYPESIAIFKRSSKQNLESRLYLIADYFRASRNSEAEIQINDLFERDPAFHLAKYAEQIKLGSPTDKSSLMATLLEAGLPENVSFECMLSPSVETCRRP